MNVSKIKFLAFSMILALVSGVSYGMNQKKHVSINEKYNGVLPYKIANLIKNADLSEGLKYSLTLQADEWALAITDEQVLFEKVENAIRQLQDEEECNAVVTKKIKINDQQFEIKKEEKQIIVKNNNCSICLDIKEDLETLNCCYQEMCKECIQQDFDKTNGCHTEVVIDGEVVDLQHDREAQDRYDSGYYRCPFCNKIIEIKKSILNKDDEMIKEEQSFLQNNENEALKEQLLFMINDAKFLSAEDREEIIQYSIPYFIKHSSDAEVAKNALNSIITVMVEGQKRIEEEK